MAHLYPDYSEDFGDIVSSAEIKLYQVMKRLSDDYHVFHSVAWISRSGGEARDGEVDFLVCHPRKGILALEVKGGRIEADYSRGSWVSVDRNGEHHSIKDPFQQATKAKHGILAKLKEHKDWKLLRINRICLGHAAFFPDVGDGRRLQGPNAPMEIIGDQTDLGDMETWLSRAFDFWGSKEDGANVDDLGTGGIKLAMRLFARVATARPVLAAHLADEEQRRLELTKNQTLILNFLSGHRRVSISGGAGTGKTVIALEKARRLASEGFDTLLTCYNKPLGNHLAEICSDESHLEAVHFHKLCKDVVDEASKKSGRDLLQEAKNSYPGLELWDQYFPIALAYALEIVDRRYDAIVVDEAQDFGEEFWLPIELMLRDPASAPLYVFLDENQNVYERVGSFPVETAPYVLDTNCRNTKQIHELAYSYFPESHVRPSELFGKNVTCLEADDIFAQAKAISKHVSNLVQVGKVPARSIAVLIADRRGRREYEDVLNRQPLPGGVVWRDTDKLNERSVVLDTVARFKGLEADVVVMWGLDTGEESERRETMYVGASRAKSILVLCGSSNTCDRILSGKVQTRAH